MDQRALARKNIEKRLSPLRNMVTQRPQRGWIRAIREALGMTTEQLAKRIGVSQPRVIALEKAETEDVVMLKTLREAAAAMECELVYMLVPRRPLDEVVRARAEQRADDELARLHHTMQLENQALTKADLKTERARMVESLIDGPARRLWDGT
jgi:predicted DNA-binding mobile mystery protein A